jgi:DNA helicase-2/ATP-dependent DNA helicase PcrA
MQTKLVQSLSESASPTVRILAVSYTVKAAEELRARFDRRLGKAARRVDAETLHGFAHDLIRRYGTWIGLPQEVGVIARHEDRVELLDRWLRGEGRELSSQELGDVLRELDASRARRQSGGRFTQEWDAALLESGVLDYPAMLERATELLSMPNVHRQLGRLYAHVIVDEAQNLTRAQYELLQVLCGRPPELATPLMLVGDDKQSIVEFSGGDPELLHQFMSEYVVTALHLSRNYRSAQAIVNIGNRVAAELGSATAPSDVMYPAPGRIGTAVTSDERSEGRLVAGWIADLLEEGLPAEALAPGEDRTIHMEQIAVLGRSAASLRSTESALRAAGVEVATAVRLEDWVTSRAGQVAAELLAWRSASSRAAGWQFCRLLDVGLDTSLDDATIATLLKEDAECAPLQVLMAAEDPSEFVGLLSELPIEGPHWDADRREFAYAWERFALRTDVVERTWSNFRAFVARMQRGSDGTPGVRLLTVHKAQGREYRAVAVVGLNDGQFPDFRAKTKKEHKAELRAFYVAVTRPARVLMLSRSTQRDSRSGPWATQPSEFLRFVDQ